MHSSRMHTNRSSSYQGGWPVPPQLPPLGVSLDQIPLNFPFVVGLDQIPLNLPLGCGPGDPPRPGTPRQGPLRTRNPCPDQAPPWDLAPPRTRHPHTRHPQNQAPPGPAPPQEEAPPWDQAPPPICG